MLSKLLSFACMSLRPVLVCWTCLCDNILTQSIVFTSFRNTGLFSQFLIPSQFQALNFHIGSDWKILHDLHIEVDLGAMSSQEDWVIYSFCPRGVCIFPCSSTKPKNLTSSQLTALPHHQCLWLVSVSLDFQAQHDQVESYSFQNIFFTARFLYSQYVQRPIFFSVITNYSCLRCSKANISGSHNCLMWLNLTN